MLFEIDDDDELEFELVAVELVATEVELAAEYERAAEEAAVFGARAAVEAACAVGFGDLLFVK